MMRMLFDIYLSYVDIDVENIVNMDVDVCRRLPTKEYRHSQLL